MYFLTRSASRDLANECVTSRITAVTDLKVPDVEWQTTVRNVRPPASNENPGGSNTFL